MEWKSEAKKFIKNSELLIKNVVIKTQIINSVSNYWKLYEPSNGSVSIDYFCIFFTSKTHKKGDLYRFKKDVHTEVFDATLNP